MKTVWSMLVLAAVALTGCSDSGMGGVSQSQRPPSPPRRPTIQELEYERDVEPLPGEAADPNDPNDPEASVDGAPAESPDKLTTEPSDDEEVVKAEVGVGKKGRGYGGGMITEPLRQRFAIEDRLNFYKYQNGMRNFKTLNGRYPKSQEEFDKEIIEKQAVRLPKLPKGHEYFYDVEKHELMVRRPKTK